MIAVEYDRGWAGARALGFVGLVVLEALVVVFLCPFSMLGDPVRRLLARGQRRLAPLVDVDPALDLREFYRVAP